MTTQHSVLNTANQHEPKGIQAASAGRAYFYKAIEDASWKAMAYAEAANLSNSLPTPITLVGPTTYTPVVLALGNVLTAGDMLAESGPVITYSGANASYGKVFFSVTLRHTHGAKQNVAVALIKNGSALNSYESIAYLDTAEKATLSGTLMVALTQGDIYKIGVKAAAGNVVMLNAFMTVIQFPHNG